MMKTCEDYLLNASSMMDGELSGEKLAETVKHLAQCEACLSEFQRFQKLQERVSREMRLPSVPARIWERIAASDPARSPAVLIPFRSRAVRILGMAAALILCFGLGYIFQNPIVPAQEVNTPIVLASQPGSMSDARFLSLTRELLTADPQYHQKMFMILSALHEGFFDVDPDALLRDQSVPPVSIMQADHPEPGEAAKTFRF